MQIQNDIKYNLTLYEIEKAIKQYVDTQIQYALDYSGTKVEFKYDYITSDGLAVVQSAVVKPAFLL